MEGSEKWKCTGCFRRWTKGELKKDPLREGALLCPVFSCEFPCQPEDSKTWKGEEDGSS